MHLVVFMLSQQIQCIHEISALSREALWTTPGVAESPSQGRQLGDVTGRLINLRRGAQYQFPCHGRRNMLELPACTKILISFEIKPSRSYF